MIRKTKKARVATKQIVLSIPPDLAALIETVKPRLGCSTFKGAVEKILRRSVSSPSAVSGLSASSPRKRTVAKR